MRWLLILLLLTSCSRAHKLVLLADARRYDYRSAGTLCRSLARQPKRGPSFGHAWVRIEGPDGEVLFEGGQTGESSQDGYLARVAAAVERGDPDPICQLWMSRPDGRLELGSGGHTPTHRLTIAIDEETAERLLSAIESYDFSTYDLREHQCTDFVVEVAALAGLHLHHRCTLPVEPSVTLDGVAYRLWTNPAYSMLTLSTPDALVREPRLGIPSRGSRCRHRQSSR